MEETNDVEFSEIKAAIDESLDQAEQREGIPLEEFDNWMRTKYGMPRGR